MAIEAIANDDNSTFFVRIFGEANGDQFGISVPSAPKYRDGSTSLLTKSSSDAVINESFIPCQS